MEYINEVTLQGRVGTVQRATYATGAALSISVCTLYAYTNKGMPVIDTQWHRVFAYAPMLQNGEPQKGDWVKVRGRIRTMKYMSAEGAEHTTTDIFANSLTVIKEEEQDNGR